MPGQTAPVMPKFTSKQRNRKRILGGHDDITVAIVQKSNPYLDREGTLQIACDAILEAGSNGAQFVVFPENWLAGYPYRSPGWNTDGFKFRQAFIHWHDAAIMVGSEDTERLGAATSKAGVYVAIGCNEMDPRHASDQIFSSIMFFGPDGQHIGSHRKTMPKGQEKMFWGMGDANDLEVFEAGIGNNQSIHFEYLSRQPSREHGGESARRIMLPAQNPVSRHQDWSESWVKAG